ncbi:MAG TPA: Gfo/Idh/MocA family oxidoreductase, partial [Hyphomicrobiaceae bacterium]|nr:Gfo/Idh/MocA family oxidoreductase [Hyphomicrobiaceae bacterium]
AICNRSPAPAQDIANTFDIPRVYSDLAGMLKQARPNVLDIITPPETHLQAISIAAEHGVNAICQKPFCTNLAEAREATKIADAAGIDLVIHENFRFQPWHRKIQELLLADETGPPYQITFRLRPGDGQGDRAYLDRQPYFQKMKRFLVHETAIHLVDTFRFLFGEVTAVYADLRQLNPAIAGEDSGTILFDFANGGRGLFDGNRLADHSAENRRLTMGEMLIEGPTSTIQLDGNGTITQRAFGANEWTPVPYEWHNHGFGGDCVYLLQQETIDAWIAGKPPQNQAREYLRNLEIEEAIYRSSHEARKIAI